MKSKIRFLFLSLTALFTFCSCGNYSHNYVPGSFEGKLTKSTPSSSHYLLHTFKVELKYDRKVNIYYEIKGLITDLNNERYNFHYKGAAMNRLIKSGSSSNELTIQQGVYLSEVIKYYEYTNTYKLEKVTLHKIDIVDVENGDSSKMYVYFLSGIGVLSALGLMASCFTKNKKEEDKIG